MTAAKVRLGQILLKPGFRPKADSDLNRRQIL